MGEYVYGQLAKYHPSANDSATAHMSSSLQGETVSLPGDAASQTNSTDKIRALKKAYPDTIGWLTIPYIGVDYPFVQAKNNRYYLDHDMDGNHLAAGTLFMDADNAEDFSDFNTIIYGHHMKDGSMFAGLDNYADPEFFKTHTEGKIYLENEIKKVEFFAFSGECNH